MKPISVIQMAMPGLRQVGDFVAAIYGPYGADEIQNRYDTYYNDYDDSPGRKYSQQYRNVSSCIIDETYFDNFITFSLMKLRACSLILSTMDRSIMRSCLHYKREASLIYQSIKPELPSTLPY